jgi:hypothetical protein
MRVRQTYSVANQLKWRLTKLQTVAKTHRTACRLGFSTNLDTVLATF